MITYTTLTRPYGGLSSLTIAPIAMPFRHISRDFKVRAMELYEQGHLPDDICNILGVSRDSFSQWRENLEVHGDVIPAHNPTHILSIIGKKDFQKYLQYYSHAVDHKQHFDKVILGSTKPVWHATNLLCSV